jgi:transposase-like protein
LDGAQGSPFAPDPLLVVLRREIRSVIKEVLQEEMGAALSVEPYERSDTRAGYRNGSREREIGTSLGMVPVEIPRARLFRPDGTEEEFQSQVLPRYHRRMKQVDDAILGTYLSGSNTRRIKQALRPLLGDVPLSKSAISRLVARLQEQFDAWRTRSLKEETFVYVYADAIHVRIRTAGHVHKVPVLAVIGVRQEGEKVLLSLEMRGSESEEAWGSVLQGLVDRGLRPPKLVIVDGGKGLVAAVQRIWVGADLQRCTVHKLRNLLSHAPVKAWEEIRADYHRIVYAETLEEARKMWERFEAQWGKKCPGVVRSLQEGGDRLLTFFRYPKAQWKSLRTTNVIERLNLEFRRRVKTQGSLPSEQAVLLVLFGLVASGQIRMRRIEGADDLTEPIGRKKVAATA